MPLQAGRYRVGAPVGHGGTAVVHRGYDRTLRRLVAIKFLGGSRTGVNPALSEARAAARLSHPNIARVYDFGRTGAGASYLVMEYLPDGTLADRLSSAGPLPLAEAARIAADVACALAAAHARGLVHRDIKPRNVMLGPSRTKVVDFGVATTAGASSTGPDGLVWGTPLYLSPEQLRGEPVRPSADVYALGLLLHECLTGSSPWRGTTAEQVIVNRHLQPVPTLPQELGLPPAFLAFYRRCVSPLPAKRPTAQEAAETLRRFTEGHPGASVRPLRRAKAARPPRTRPRLTSPRLARPHGPSPHGTRALATGPRAVAMAGLAMIIALIGVVLGQLTTSAPSDETQHRPAMTATSPSGPSRAPAADA
ncbi:MAG: protein kinase [Actinomycetota bacterium]|nr:protein kinase [Actinomycetota bacterium]